MRAHSGHTSGLVEVGVGLVPGGGGCKELCAERWRSQPDDARSVRGGQAGVSRPSAWPKVATSAEEARSAGFLRETDGVDPQSDHVIYDAKQTALGLFARRVSAAAAAAHPPAGPSGYANIRSILQMMLEAHQIRLTIWSSAAPRPPCSPAATPRPPSNSASSSTLDLEREAPPQLCGEEKTRDRMMYMLVNNKPCRT